MTKTHLALVALVLSVTSLAASTPEDAFLAENQKAMDRMMQAMDVKRSGDVDVDFVNMMRPHHQGAIDMAILELCYGKNERLKRLAQEIIVTQQQEIAAMRLAIGDPLPASTPSRSVQQPLASQQGSPGSPCTDPKH